jgi:hypothetical protein
MDMSNEAPRPTKVRIRKVPLSADEVALRDAKRDLRARIKATPDPYLSGELRALRAKAKALRETTRALFVPRPKGRPRLSAEERAARLTGCEVAPREGRSPDQVRGEDQLITAAYQSSYWRRNKAALVAKRKALLASMTDAEREIERQRMRIARKKSANRNKAQIAELLKTVEALSGLLEGKVLSKENVS